MMLLYYWQGNVVPPKTISFDRWLINLTRFWISQREYLFESKLLDNGISCSRWNMFVAVIRSSWRFWFIFGIYHCSRIRSSVSWSPQSSMIIYNWLIWIFNLIHSICSLGADHDDAAMCSDKRDKQLHIMASSTTSDVIVWSWSSCSKRFITKLLECVWLP